MIPLFESTDTGLSLDYKDYYNIYIDQFGNTGYDTKYQNCIIYFYSYHFILVLLLISIFRTVLSNPGTLDDEYYSMY